MSFTPGLPAPNPGGFAALPGPVPARERIAAGTLTSPYNQPSQPIRQAAGTMTSPYNQSPMRQAAGTLTSPYNPMTPRNAPLPVGNSSVAYKSPDTVPSDPVRQAAGTLTSPYDQQPQPASYPFSNFANESLPTGYRERYLNENILSVENYDGDAIAQPSTGTVGGNSVSPSQGYDGPANIAPSQQYSGESNVAPSQQYTGGPNVAPSQQSSPFGGMNQNDGNGGDARTVVSGVLNGQIPPETLTPDILASLPPQVLEFIKANFPGLLGAGGTGTGSPTPGPWQYPGLLTRPYTTRQA
jgi:hypothetical protein